MVEKLRAFSKGHSDNSQVIKERLDYWEDQNAEVTVDFEMFHRSGDGKEIDEEAEVDREKLLKVAVEANLLLKRATDYESYDSLASEYEEEKKRWKKKYKLSNDTETLMADGKTTFADYVFAYEVFSNS